MKKNILLIPMAFLFTGTPLAAQSDTTHRSKALFSGMEYKVEMQATGGNNATPLWLNANKYGLSSIHPQNGYMRAGVFRSLKSDSLRNWRVGYGLDLAAAYDFTSSVVLQQFYVDLQYKKVRLSIGSKERAAALKNPELSSGSQTFGINARPVPTVQFELPDYISITGKSNWLAVKGYFGYGMITDGKWQKDYIGMEQRYTQKSLFHNKAGFLRIGNEEKFPLVFEGGVEMGCQFGGTIYNFGHGELETIKMGHSLKDFVKAIYSGGSDATDGAYANAAGNTVGSWLFSLSYKAQDWKIRAYYDHFFEDHSMLFFQYGWLDGLIGGEITLPKNRFVSAIVYEYMSTKYQSGALYHDHTEAIPDQISARDNYYNHGIYWGWQHWGQAIGNPLYTSPLYQNDGTLEFKNNRMQAHHIGINGQPLPELHYRVLYSYTSNWGTYGTPYDEVKYGNSFLMEVGYAPHHIGKINTKGWSATAAFGLDRGKQIGNNTGFQFTLRKTGILTK